MKLELDNGIYPKTLWIITENEDINKFLLEYNHKSERIIASRCLQYDDGFIVIIIKNMDLNNLAIICHELFHASNHIKKLYVPNMDDESQAYLIEHWMAQIIFKINNKKYNRFYNK